MKQDEVKKWIEELIQKDQLWKFYKSREWMDLKEQVLRENHHECAECRKHGKITRYDEDEQGNRRLLSTVHHVQFVRKHPALALSRTYTYEGVTYQNLIPVCRACHNRLHPEKMKRSAAQKERFTNEERW